MLHPSADPKVGCIQALPVCGNTQRRSVHRSSKHCCRPRAVAEPTSETHIRPYYKRFKSEGEILRDNIREWKELSAEGVELPEPTTRSKLFYILSWIKYNIVPEIVRYLWFCIWSAIRQAWHPLHRHSVLQGAKIDAWLLQKAHRKENATFSRKVALKRFHWQMTAWQDLVYRYDILKTILLSSIRREENATAQAENAAAMAPTPTIL